MGAATTYALGNTTHPATGGANPATNPAKAVTDPPTKTVQRANRYWQVRNACSHAQSGSSSWAVSASAALKTVRCALATPTVPAAQQDSLYTAAAAWRAVQLVHMPTPHSSLAQPAT